MSTPTVAIERKQEIEEYILETIDAIVDHVNRRAWTQDSNSEYLATATANDVKQTLILEKSIEDSKLSVVGCSKSLQNLFRQFISAYPSYRLRVTDVSTRVHEDAGWAISYVGMETADMPPGVVRGSMGIFEWKVVERNWLLDKYRGILGNM
ncbi:hypothetical protein M409DRAFT_21440 [Zasmidium cellare ATCC 36951]|uniref:SnoaL-like domain-containing protein n=1 Tax=Zasmidium cellare ATCC 36951 TaxID=1080233 RepID=A0A6A6CMZ5_ZASCE|nr:uncharacterized protein M409DRAFT_21440 [Zasmidium cellare ATCC 36951]KAF2167993.1 hypothetical protein M409DRAFT_21440 [Zasmidium cellare ATCC 36951]